MINVDRIYQRVLTLANKEQRGYITPQEFNLLANHAQMDIFEQYFYDLNQFLRTPGNSTVHADTVDITEEKISVFETSAELQPVGDTIILDDLGDFYRLTTIIDPAENIIFEPVTRKEITLFQNSPIAAPTEQRPVYTLDLTTNRVRFFGRIPDDAQINYIKTPSRVNWTYVVVGNKALHNSTSPDLVNFELHPSEETELVLKILSLAGFTLKDQMLQKVAANEDLTNTQQEKQ
tara:strand:- start:697 stop:1398 length:702 start_codon:yes stop_codon:yes gene_type:complete